MFVLNILVIIVVVVVVVVGRTSVCLGTREREERNDPPLTSVSFFQIMPSSLKSSGQKAQSNRTLSRFDRGSADILRHFPPSSNSSIISLQLLFFALLEILSLHLTDNDPIKSRLLFQLQLYFLQSSKILPTSTSLSAGSIRQLPLFQNYVRILRDSIQTALGVVQQPSSASSDGSTITSLLEKEYQKVLLTTASPANISIDIPQADIRLKVPLPLTMNGTMTPNEFDTVVIFRYVQDFFELDKLGKGAFGESQSCPCPWFSSCYTQVQSFVRETVWTIVSMPSRRSCSARIPIARVGKRNVLYVK